MCATCCYECFRLLCSILKPPMHVTLGFKCFLCRYIGVSKSLCVQASVCKRVGVSTGRNSNRASRKNRTMLQHGSLSALELGLTDTFCGCGYPLCLRIGCDLGVDGCRHWPVVLYAGRPTSRIFIGREPKSPARLHSWMAKSLRPAAQQHT